MQKLKTSLNNQMKESNNDIIQYNSIDKYINY